MPIFGNRGRLWQAKYAATSPSQRSQPLLPGTSEQPLSSVTDSRLLKTPPSSGNCTMSGSGHSNLVGCDCQLSTNQTIKSQPRRSRLICRMDDRDLCLALFVLLAMVAPRAAARLLALRPQGSSTSQSGALSVSRLFRLPRSTSTRTPSSPSADRSEPSSSPV